MITTGCVCFERKEKIWLMCAEHEIFRRTCTCTSHFALSVFILRAFVRACARNHCVLNVIITIAQRWPPVSMTHL